MTGTWRKALRHENYYIIGIRDGNLDLHFDIKVYRHATLRCAFPLSPTNRTHITYGYVRNFFCSGYIERILVTHHPLVRIHILHAGTFQRPVFSHTEEMNTTAIINRGHWRQQAILSQLIFYCPVLDLFRYVIAVFVLASGAASARFCSHLFSYRDAQGIFARKKQVV